MAVLSESLSLQIGEIAKLAGVSPDTIRHYERVGVLPHPPRTQGGYRRFSPQAVSRVRLIRNALAIGFSLSELASVLRVKYAGGIPCKSVHSLAKGKLQLLRQQIEDLRRLRKHMEGILRGWDRRIAQTPRGRRAELLESLKRSPFKPAPRRKLK